MASDVRGNDPMAMGHLSRPSHDASAIDPTDHAGGPVEASFERSGAVRWSLVVLVAMVGAGLLGGLLWSLLADPPGYTVSRQSASMGETEAGKQFGVEVAYAGIAVALSLLAGLLAGRFLSRYGWVLALALTAGGLAAAGVSWTFGRALGPPDPSGVVGEAAVGTVVPLRLDVDAFGLFLAWPAAALFGLLLALAVIGRDTDSRSAHTPGDGLSTDAPQTPASASSNG